MNDHCLHCKRHHPGLAWHALVCPLCAEAIEVINNLEEFGSLVEGTAHLQAISRLRAVNQIVREAA